MDGRQLSQRTFLCKPGFVNCFILLYFPSNNFGPQTRISPKMSRESGVLLGVRHPSRLLWLQTVQGFPGRGPRPACVSPGKPSDLGCGQECRVGAPASPHLREDILFSCTALLTTVRSLPTSTHLSLWGTPLSPGITHPRPTLSNAGQSLWLVGHL